MLQHVQELDLPAEEKSKLMDTLNQLAISSLPDASYRKHFAHRKGVPGFSNDAMRAFADSQFHAAHHIARINYADQLSKSLDDLNTLIKEDKSGDTTEPTEVYNELSKRQDLILNPNTHPFAALMGSLGFIMSIGGSVAVGKGMTHEQAIAEAARVIKQSHFNYRNSNRARFMNGNVARVLTMFKQFSQNMTYLLWRNTYLSLKGESPEVKREARRMLMGLAATHFAFAGALGLPLGVFGISTVLLPLLAMGMGDGDDPWDWEVEFRNLLAESFGTTMGEAIAKGPLRALVPWADFSSRVGLGDMWVRGPNKEMEGRADTEAWMLTLLGPVAGYAGTMGTAKKAFNEGKIERGIEAMMPKMISAPLKALRYANEGVKSMKGDDLGLELSAGDILAQALGWTPSSVSELYEARAAIKNREHLLTMRRAEIINQWSAAKTAGDLEGQQEAMEMAKTFSEKNPEMKVTPATLVKSMASKARNAQQIKNGVYLPKSREALRETGAFADIN